MALSWFTFVFEFIRINGLTLVTINLSLAMRNAMINSLMKHVETPPLTRRWMPSTGRVARAHWNLPPQNLFTNLLRGEGVLTDAGRWPYRPVHLPDVRPKITLVKDALTADRVIGATSTSPWRRPISIGCTKTSRGI